MNTVFYGSDRYSRTPIKNSKIESNLQGIVKAML